jgi:hypothetical protein
MKTIGVCGLTCVNATQSCLRASAEKDVAVQLGDLGRNGRQALHRVFRVAVDQDKVVALGKAEPAKLVDEGEAVGLL